MSTSKKILTRLAAVAMLAVLLTASSCDEKGLGDAGVGNTDDREAFVINMPDTFANVAIKCKNGIAFVSTTRDAPVQVIESADYLCDGDEVRRELTEAAG